MKPSSFNSFFQYEEYFVGYNAYFDAFLLLDPMLVDLYNAAVTNNNFVELQEIHPTFYECLIENNFIITEDIDELDLVRKRRHDVDYNLDEYLLTINPTMNCNFKCWYCYESHIKGSVMKPENINAVQKFIYNTLTLNDIKKFHISFFGGEPMLYFDKVIVPILQSTKDVCNKKSVVYSTSYTSNGFLINSDIISVLKQYNTDHIQITLDGSREQHDKVRFVSSKQGSYDKILSNIKLLTENDIFVLMRINYTEHNIEGIKTILNDLEEIGFNTKNKLNMTVSFHNVWQEGKANLEKISELIDLFRDKSYKTESLYGTVNTLLNSCYADKINQATINYNGEVHKCTARDFTKDNMEGMLTTNGIIEWNEKRENRMGSKFKNKPCLTCPILPICNGGCSQQAIENKDNDYCVWDGSGVSKLDIVKEKFKQHIYNLSDETV